MTSLAPIGLPAAAILSGGHSRRMGRTKALIEIDGVPMLTRVATALAQGGLSDIAVIGGERADLASLGLPMVPDLFPGDGPVGGLLTALAHFENRNVLLVPCDVPFLDPRSVQLVVRAFETSSADVAVARTDRPEPLCAVWRSTGAASIRRDFEGGTRAMHQVLNHLVSIEVDVDPDSLRNVNRPDDLPPG